MTAQGGATSATTLLVVAEFAEPWVRPSVPGAVATGGCSEFPSAEGAARKRMRNASEKWIFLCGSASRFAGRFRLTFAPFRHSTEV